MSFILTIPVQVRLALLGIIGALVGGQINRAIYRLAWDRRAIGPWSAPHAGAPPRHWLDRLPVAGWYFLRREAAIHGAGFWVRPLLIEVFAAAGLAALYWWETVARGLAPPLPTLPPSPAMLHAEFLSHALLGGLMLVATFIDFDEQTIPDAITVPGTLCGLLWVALLPDSLLPVGSRPDGAVAIPLVATHPYEWPEGHDGARGLGVGLLILAAWSWALAPKTWTLRRGPAKAVQYLVVSMVRRGNWMLAALLCTVTWLGTIAVWVLGGTPWEGLLSALLGLAFGGGLIWMVRLVAGSVLGKEAMGFGDVTLMAMIGTYLGWQSSLLIFFMAPLAAVVISVAQWALTRRRDIAFGPYLCLAAGIAIVLWRPLWLWAERMFELPGLLLGSLSVCLVLMGILLGAWRLIEGWLFPPSDDPDGD